jgi:DNA-binding CsgD family transcriptional regulator
MAGGEDDERTTTVGLVGRDADLAVIGRWLHGGTGGTLVLSGEAGVGKTALLRAAGRSAASAGHRRLEVGGLPPEIEVSYAALDRLLQPLRPLFASSPPVHRAALAVALGLDAGAVPAPATVGAATLDLLRRSAADSPVLVLLDDAQWLDRGTAAALAHVARRTTGTDVWVLVGIRSGGDPAGGWVDGDLPVHEVHPLTRGPSEQLVRSSFPSLSGEDTARVVAEARGLPLVLEQLPARLAARSPGGVRSSEVPSLLGTRLADLFVPSVRNLPRGTRDVLLLAALQGDGDLAVLHAAAGDDLLALLAAAERARLVHVRDDSGRLEFHHPLVRSTLVDVASRLERRRAHRALAEVLRDQPIRRAWHLAHATDGPDESVAELLEEAAGLSLRRGDGATAASALGRAAELSTDDEQRRRRLVRAASVDAEVVGDLDTARRLLSSADGPEDGASLLPAVLAAAALLLNADAEVTAAHRLLSAGVLRHPGRGRADDPVLLDALHALVVTSWYGGRPGLWPQLAGAVAALRPAPPTVLDVCVRTFGDPVRLAAPVLPRVDELLGALTTESDPVRITRVALGCVYVDRVSDCREALGRVIRNGRSGSAAALAIHAMVSTCVGDWTTGRWDEAVALADEGVALAERLGYRRYTVILGWYIRSLVRAARGGQEAAVLAAADELAAWGEPRGVGMAAQFAAHIRGLAALGAGRWEEALTAVTAISPAGVLPPWTPHALWVALDLVEAAVRAGRREEAAAHAEALRRAGLSRLSSRLDLVTRGATAMAADDEVAGPAYERALAVPDAGRWPFDQARIRLGHAEHLRRRRDLARARDEFRGALDTFDRLGAAPWSARAAAGLRASGRRTARPGRPDTSDLTARDWRILRLAASGLTNKQIGAQLYLSPRTVGATLYRLYPRFGITSRAALHDALERWGPPPD